MSRYTLTELDLVCTVGMDYTFQVWCVDHRGEPLPFTYPCKMTVKDTLGQTLFETETTNPDTLTDASITPSAENGVIQVSLPRALTSLWFPTTCSYDLWATVVDDESSSSFPNGQQLPVCRGRFVITRRTTEMEE